MLSSHSRLPFHGAYHLVHPTHDSMQRQIRIGCECEMLLQVQRWQGSPWKRKLLLALDRAIPQGQGYCLQSCRAVAQKFWVQILTGDV